MASLCLDTFRGAKLYPVEEMDMSSTSPERTVNTEKMEVRESAAEPRLFEKCHSPNTVVFCFYCVMNNSQIFLPHKEQTVEFAE